MNETCRRPDCPNPVLPGKKLCAYHKAERDAKITRAARYAGRIAKEAGPYVFWIVVAILTRGKVKRPPKFG